MIYKNWMSYIKDDVKLCNIVIPGAHNTGSYGMKKIACCQDGNLVQQFNYGIRYYCMRLDTVDGQIVQCHGLMKGEPFERSLIMLRRAILSTNSEFIIIDLREYYPQQLGPFHFKFHADPEAVDKLIEKYLEPEKYALTDFKNIADITMGDIRCSGKKYLLINHEEAYKYSVNCEIEAPWDKKIHGLKAKNFIKEAINFLDKDYSGLFWFQTQQTPNLGTDIGFKTPRKLDKSLRPHFTELIAEIAKDPKRLLKTNIIAGDFMTEDYMKVKEILNLNLLKNNVIESLKEEYRKGLAVV